MDLPVWIYGSMDLWAYGSMGLRVYCLTKILLDSPRGGRRESGAGPTCIPILQATTSYLQVDK